MEKLEILYGVQGNGISFGLRNRDVKIFKGIISRFTATERYFC